MDLTLVNKAPGEEPHALDMGTGFDYFGPQSWPTYLSHQCKSASPPNAAATDHGRKWVHPLFCGVVAFYAEKRTFSRSVL